ncbi:hypothetical protein [Frigidibacter oleivorans]|uniref:hypothetical protein n=1 Tax=Frigidibacter oleivorans TaxID=2487129 RepID=UPI000F8EFAA5|nr:hypothetical protein [Frigidibacter oleivorans]
MAPITFHSPLGGFDFLGLRRARDGQGFEIVYDDGVTRRMVWRVQSEGRRAEAMLGEALRSAVNKPRVLPALYSELKKRSIAIEAVASA